MNQKTSHFTDLGGGFFLRSQEVPNGYGGCHPVNMVLFRGFLPVRRLTGRSGRIRGFPGTVQGPWKDLLKRPFRPKVEFSATVGPFQDGLARFSWTVQPDGFYYADEDGFGAEDDVEVRLYALINTSGRFVTPFSEVPPGPGLVD